MKSKLTLIKRLTLTIVLLVSCYISGGQITFDNVFDTLVTFHGDNGSKFTYGSGLSFFDVNEDGFDDITMVPPKNSFLSVDENQGGFFRNKETNIPIIGLAKAIQWFDYDNDGDNDMLIAYADSNVQLFRHDSNYLFTNVTALSSILADSSEYYGITVADMDNNGFLDVYVSNYSDCEPNLFFLNDAGVFTEMAVAAGVDNGFKNSFQTIMFDFNQDTLPDIYLSNDLCDTNELFINNGDSTFSALPYGTSEFVAIMDGMGVVPTDFNYDGHLDLFIANTNYDNKFFVSDSLLSHTDMAEYLQLDSFRTTWGGEFFDADLDRDEDLYMANGNTWFEPPFSYDKFFENIGDSLVDSTNQLDMNLESQPSYSTALGDFNADGLSDILVFRTIPGHPRFFENTTITDNKWIKIFLEGSTNNRNAVGSLISSYVGGIRRDHWRFSSESFIGQNSQHITIGLGDTCGVDSLLIRWPNGDDTTFYNLECGQHIRLKEGGSPFPISKILLPDGPYICGNDSVRLVNPDPSHSVVWSTGATTDTITVASPGVFGLTSTNQFGNTANADSVAVIAKPIPDFQVQVIRPSCYGVEDGSLEAIPSNIQFDYTYKWSNGSPFAEITDLGPGDYAVTIEDEFGCKNFDTKELTQPDSLHIVEEHSDILCYGENNAYALVMADGGTLPYTYVWSNGVFTSMNNEITAGTYSVTVSDVRGCFKNLSLTVTQPDELLVDTSSIRIILTPARWRLVVTAEGGSKPYKFRWNDDTTSFPIGFQNSVDTGIYTVTIVDNNGCDTSYVFDLRMKDTNDTSTFIEYFTYDEKSFGQWYPNPSRGNLIWTGQELPNEVKIFTPDGRLLRECYGCNSLNFRYNEYRGIIIIHSKKDERVKTQRIVLIN